jgi:hypothetical protein
MKINIIADTTPSIALLNAIAEHFPKDDFASKLGMIPPNADVDVVLTVNGVEIPFAPMVQSFWDQCVRDRDARATEIAMEAIKGAGFDNLFQVIRNAEWEIEQAIKAAMVKVTKEIEG